MAQLVADFVLSRLKEWGVHRVFGYPGDGINGFLGAFDRAEGDPEFVQARHEEMAAFMACGHAKYTGEVGVCIATSGPGAIHLLNGLYDAKLDHAPVRRDRRAAEADARSAPTTSRRSTCRCCSRMSPSTSRLHGAGAGAPPDRPRRAARLSTASGVATLIFPNDVQEEKAVASPPREHGAVYSSVGYRRRASSRTRATSSTPRRSSTRARRSRCSSARARWAPTDEVVEAAELLGAGVAKALLGKAALPDDLPFVTGSIGLLGTTASYELMTNCDTLLMVGTSFPYSEWLPMEGQARCVQIDLDGRRVGMRYPIEVEPDRRREGDAARADAAARAQGGPLVARGDRGPGRRVVARDRGPRAMLDADPMNPQRVVWELYPRLPDDAILAADSGSSTNWWARDLKIGKGMLASLSGTLATMGPACRTRSRRSSPTRTGR